MPLSLQTLFYLETLHESHLITSTVGMYINALSLLSAAVDSATPKLNTFVRYAKVELVPPTPAEFGDVAQGFNKIVKGAKTGAWKKLSVKVSD